MIEISQSYDLLPGADPSAYGAAAMKGVETFRQARGLVELRAQRNLLGSPLVRVTTVWNSLEDWARARQSAEFQAVDAALRPFIANLRIDIWAPSPLLPEVLRGPA